MFKLLSLKRNLNNSSLWNEFKQEKMKQYQNKEQTHTPDRFQNKGIK